MTDKLELKSCHEVIDTVDVANIESIFYGGKPTDPDILTVVMKGGKRIYCDEICPIDPLQEENSFDSHIQEGDKITVNEDGSRFNRSQLERVVELSRYSKPYEAKRVKRTSTDIEAAMKEIDELSKAFTEAHPEGGDQMLREIRGEHHIVDNNEMVSEELEEAAREAATWHGRNGVDRFFPNDYKKFIAGAMWQKRYDNIPQELVENYCEFIKEGGKNVCALINAVNACNAKKAKCISNDLEEAASQYSFNIPSAIFNDLTTVLQNIWKREIEGAFIAGAKWMEQRLKYKKE